MRDALRNLEGVIAFEVDWDSGEARLMFDEAVIRYDEIWKLFEARKFNVTRLK